MISGAGKHNRQREQTMTALYVRWSIVAVILLGAALFFVTNTVAVATFYDVSGHQEERAERSYRSTSQAPRGQLIVAESDSTPAAPQAKSDHIRTLIARHQAAKSNAEAETPTPACR